MGDVTEVALCKKIHAIWKNGTPVSDAMKRVLIDIARRNGWAVPATAAAQAKLQGFNVSGLVTK